MNIMNNDSKYYKMNAKLNNSHNLNRYLQQWPPEKDTSLWCHLQGLKVAGSP